MFCPDLSGLALARPTGMQAAAPITALPHDLVAKVLMLTREGDYKAACDAAAAWGATHTTARDDGQIWLLLIDLVFVRPGLGVQNLTTADLAAGHNARRWFFELCERLLALRRAEARLKTLTDLSDQRDQNLQRLRQLAIAARNAAFSSPNDSHSRLLFRNLQAKYDDMEGYMLDTVHPGVPYDRQIPDVRILLVAAQRALRASPFDAVARRRLHKWLDRVFEPTILPSDSESDDDAVLNSGDDGFIVDDDAPLEYDNPFDNGGGDDDEDDAPALPPPR